MEKVSRQVTETQKEIINGREVLYQYSFDEKNPESLITVNFRSQDKEGKQITGTYAQGQFNISGQGNTDTEFELVSAILKSVIKLIEDTVSELTKVQIP